MAKEAAQRRRVAEVGGLKPKKTWNFEILWDACGKCRESSDGFRTATFDRFDNNGVV